MLRELIAKNRVDFADSFDTWQDAVRGCCQTLIADGSITEEYPEAIIENIQKYGPYVVITDDLAIPHTKANARGVNTSAINFTKVRRPVEFEPGNPEKNARLIFTLAACNMDEHYENMEKLGAMLLNGDLLRDLAEVGNLEELAALADRYNM